MIPEAVQYSLTQILSVLAMHIAVQYVQIIGLFLIDKTFQHLHRLRIVLQFIATRQVIEACFRDENECAHLLLSLQTG